MEQKICQVENFPKPNRTLNNVEKLDHTWFTCIRFAIHYDLFCNEEVAVVSIRKQEA